MLHGKSTYDKKIAEQEKELERLKTARVNELEALNASQDERELAIWLHRKLCTFNHMDGCSWEYAVKDGVHNWGEYSHSEYLNRAKKLLPKYNKDDIIDIITKAKGFTKP